MNQTIKTVLIAAIAAVVVVLIGFALVGNQSGETLGAVGVTRFPNSGLVARCLSASTSTPQSGCTDGALSVIGNATLTGGLTLGGGTNIRKYSCVSDTWNPAAFSSSTVATTTLLTTWGFGTTLDVSLATSTSADQWSLTANVFTTGSTTVALSGLVGTQAYLAGLNLATTTVKVCGFE